MVNIANAEERIFYATNIQSSQCLTGDIPLNQYTLDNADLIIIKGSGFGATGDELARENACYSGQYMGGVFFNPVNGKYNSISCFTYVPWEGVVKNGLMSWNDSEIRFYAPKNISNNIYVDGGIHLRIYDTFHNGGNDCKTATLSLSPLCSSFTYSNWSTCQSNGT